MTAICCARRHSWHTHSTRTISSPSAPPERRPRTRTKQRKRCTMAEVSCRRIGKEYDGGVQAVKGIDLDIADEEFVVLVGPSGCGKSTTLRMIAGLEEITGGEILIGGEVVNDVPPRDRDIAMVFQNYALYPHMSV